MLLVYVNTSMNNRDEPESEVFVVPRHDSPHWDYSENKFSKEEEKETRAKEEKRTEDRRLQELKKKKKVH